MCLLAIKETRDEKDDEVYMQLAMSLNKNSSLNEDCIKKILLIFINSFSRQGSRRIRFSARAHQATP
jgi:hypothetical protein